MRYLTPLGAAAALLVGGAVGYAVDETVTGVALLSAGLVTLGSWLSEAIRSDHNRKQSQP